MKRQFLRTPNTLLCLVYGLVLFPCMAGAQSVASPVTDADKDKVIQDLQRRVEALERRLSAGAPSSSSSSPNTASNEAPTNAPVVSARPSLPPPSPSNAAGNEPAGEETSRALERSLVREGGLVLPSKTFEIEPRVEFDYRGSNTLQISNIGGQAQLSRQDLKRELLRTSLGFRVGLPWATQVEAALPYSLNRERRVTLGGTDETDRASGFGGVELGVTKQLANESAQSPGVLGSLRFVNATDDEDFNSAVSTGSRHRSLQAALTIVKRQDPLVLFGSLSHAINYSRTFGTVEIDPGNTTGVKVGSILAVSPSTSMRFGLEFARTGEIRVNGLHSPGSSAVTGLFSTGLSFVLSPKILLGVDAGIGLTSSSPDFRLGLSLPIRY